jgi:hypothetical protein
MDQKLRRGPEIRNAQVKKVKWKADLIADIEKGKFEWLGTRDYNGHKKG